MKLHYSYDEEGKYLTARPSRLSPADKNEVYLLPKNATFTPPPESEDTTKIPYYNKIEKKWELRNDPQWIKKLAADKKLEQEKKDKKLREKLSEVDEYGAVKYINVNGEAKPITNEARTKLRIAKIKEICFDKYTRNKDKFLELAAYCYVSNNINAKDKIKEFKDKTEEVWNNIDGTKKHDEIIWPEIPEI